MGELLQPGGVAALKQLGLEACLEGIDGIEVQGYAIFKTAKESVVVKYPTDKSPNRGKAFHHGKFIMKLRQAAKSTPNVTCLEGSVSTLLKKQASMGEEIVEGVSVSIKGKEEHEIYHAPLTIVADGCFSKFRKQFISKDVTVKSHFVGFVLEDCPLPFPHHGHVVLAQPSPILLYQIGTKDTRILVDVPGKLPSVSDGALQVEFTN